MNLLIATTNPHKLKEFRTLFAGLPLVVTSLKELPAYQEVEESGKTFEENAALKALGYAAQSGMMTLAEDSGLCVDALDGAPGVYSARFAGTDKSDAENNRKLLRLMEKIPVNCRGAHYTSVIAVAKPGEVLATVRGEVHGVIHTSEEGCGGFGYDPLFYYHPYQATFGQVSAELKHQVSHRAQACQKIKGALESLLKECQL